MADPILSAIDRQQTACTLLALRSVLRRDGRWSEAKHGAAFLAKYEERAARWAK